MVLDGQQSILKETLFVRQRTPEVRVFLDPLEDLLEDAIMARRSFLNIEITMIGARKIVEIAERAIRRQPHLLIRNPEIIPQLSR